MRRTLITLLCEALLRLAKKKGDAVSQINIHYESGDTTLYFASAEEADRALRLVKKMDRLTPEWRQRIAEALRFADDNMESNRHG